MKRIVSVLLVLTLVLSGATVWATESATDVSITILQTSDMHGRIYPHDYALDASDSDVGFAKVATYVKSVRSEVENVLVLDTGDTIQDNSAELFNSEDIHPTVRAMNDIGYDAWTLGNHEFNFGLDLIDKNVAGFNGAVLGANIVEIDTGENYVMPYVIKEVDGVRVAIVGLIAPHIPRWEAATPEHFENLEFNGIKETTTKMIAELEGKYDVLVGSFHTGPDGEYGEIGLRAIATEFPQFDVIFGGHAHSEINETVNEVLILEPKAYGNRISRADLIIEKTGDNYSVKAIAGSTINTKEIAADEEMLATYKYVHDESVTDANIVVGEITSDFISYVDYITGESTVTTIPTSQLMDTAIIDLINEVQMYYTEAEVGSAALFNVGSNLTQGDFKKKDVAFVYKYPNTLIGTYITGENLLEYMEWSTTYYNTYMQGDLTISFNQDIRGYNYDMFSGITYDVDVSKEAGSRIVNAKIDGMAVDMNKMYKLSVNNYRFGTLLGLELVTADDKYYDSVAMFSDIPDGRIRDLIIKYTKEVKDGKLMPTVDNNWKIIGTNIDMTKQQEVFQLVREGRISIPTSEDGRTLNVKALTENDLPTVVMPPTEVPVEMPDAMTKYTVMSGDVLWKIARMYNTTWQMLADYNMLENPNLIFPDQVILIP